MNKNALRNYLSMLWQKRLTSLQVLKAIIKSGFCFNNRKDAKLLLSILKDIEKNRLFINNELLEEIMKMNKSQSGESQKNAS